MFSDIQGCVFTPDPDIALFQYCVSLSDYNVSVQGTVSLAESWKSDTVPHFNTWLTCLTGVLHCTSGVCNGASANLDMSYNISQPFLDHFDHYNVDSKQLCSA